MHFNGMRLYSNGQERIITNPDVLNDSYILTEIHNRESKIKEIALNLHPITENGKPFHSWLYGKPGVGKTATARYILNKLKSDTGIQGIYINCWENPTFFSILDCIVRELRLLGAEKLSTSFKLDRLKRHLNNNRIVIFLDEIDQPPPKERNAILYNLSDLPTVGLICACNSQYTYFCLEDRVKSRLNPARIHFEEYTSDELLAILNQRALEAFAPDSYSDDLLQDIAHLAEGDARIAIQTLLNSARLAEKNGQEKIKNQQVRKAWNSAKDVKKTYLLHKLTDHHKLLYELIKKNPGILSGDLWRLYLKKCTEKHIVPIAVRTYSDYCNILVKLKLVKAKRAAIQGKVREFQRL